MQKSNERVETCFPRENVCFVEVAMGTYVVLVYSLLAQQKGGSVRWHAAANTLPLPIYYHIVVRLRETQLAGSCDCFTAATQDLDA